MMQQRCEKNHSKHSGTGAECLYYRNGRKYKHRTLILIVCQLCQCKSVSTLYLSAGEPLAIVSPRDEKHLKIRVFRKSLTFEFCSAHDNQD